MDFTQSSPRKNLASQYLKSIGSPILSGSPPPLAPTSRHNAGLSNLNDADSIAFRNSGGLDPDSPSRMTNLENENPFKSPKRLSQSPAHLTSPTRLQKSPSFKSFSTLSPVQKLIQQKEKDAINNNAEDIPVLPQSPTRFGSPLRSPTRINKSPSSSKLNNLASPVKNRYPYSNDTILGNKHGSPKSEDHLSKSQIKRMNQINSSISNSPSIKSLKKLVSVENKMKEKNFSKVEPVHGLQSRVRLKKDISQNDISSISSIPKRNLGAWMDADRESLQYLEFLSRIEEAKLWIESCLDETIELSENGDSLVDFQDYLRNGIILAKLVKLFDPSSKFKIFYGGKSAENTEYKSKSGLNFRFTENINVFIKFLNKIKLPDMFIFETRDLFEMKDFPKVVFCIHALSYLLAYHEKAPSLTKIDNMSSSVTESDIKKVQSKIRGVRLPNFEDIDEGVRVNADLGITPADFSFINQKDDDENDASFFANAKTNITKSSSRMEDIKENDDEENSIDNSEISSDNIAGENSDILDNTETNETETENDNNESISDNTESISDNLDEFSSDKIDNSTVERYNKIIKKYDTSYIQRSPDTSKVFDFNDISSIASNEDLFNNIEDIQMKYSSISAIDDKELRTSVMEIMTGKRQKKFDDTIDYTERLNELEAIARGSLYRFELKVNRLMLKTFTPDTIALQSIIRGNAIRKNLKTTQNKLTANSRSLSVLQAILKSRIKEDVTAGKKMYLKIYEDEIINLQSNIRKKLLKNSIFKQKKILFLNTSKIIILQSKIRGNYVRNNFQDICNRYNESPQHNRQKSKRKPVPKLDEDTERHLKEFNDKQNKAALDKATLKCIPRADKYQILELQSVIRGSIVRNRINRLFDRMLICEDCVTSLNSIARAKLARKELKETVVKLQNSKNSVILIQSAVRSVLCRFSLDVMLDDLEDEEESISNLQAIIRGNATRKLFKDRMEYFKRSDNVRKIVKLQSFIRANNEGSAFKSLIHESNPPFKAVKHFIGLLRGNDSQVEDELAIKKYQEEILTECKKIEVLEGNLTDLSNKIKILKRNNVDIIDITKIKQKNKELIDEYSKELDDNLRKSIGPGSSTSQDRKSDDAIQAIERFLFVLQSKPEYLARVFKAMDEDIKFGRDKPNISGVGSTTNAIKILLSGYNDGEYDFEELVIKLFNYSGPTASTSIKPSRDEFLYLKLIIACLHNSVSFYQDIHEFKSEFKKSTVFKNIETSWKSLLLRFTLLPQYRKYTKSVFGDAILLVTSNEDAWFESNPEVIKDELDARANIYGDDDDDVYDDTDRDFFNDLGEKLGSGKQKKSTNPFDDERVASQFVNNSTELRSTVQDVLRIVSSHVQQIPISVRIICKEYFNALKIKFSGESERFYLSCVGEIFSKCYISKFFLMPENFGVNIESAYENPYISERVKQNLFEVAKVFNQVMLMRAFGKNNLLLQPLNEFIQDCVSPVRMFLRELIDVDSLEVEFSMNPIYDDLTSASKPKLRIEENDLTFSITLLNSQIDLMAPERNDIYRYYLKNVTDLFALSKGHIDFSSLKSDGYLLLELKPTTETAESLDKWEEKSLMAQAKCYLTYIIQIQDGEDLVDVLTSKTSNQQEYAFQELVSQGSKNKDKYQTIEERKFLDNIHKLSFYKVKKRGLQLVLELEQLGLTTRNDGYQSILNEIANDIKHKKSQKEERARKLKVVVGTLTKLKEKERSCTTFYQEYNSHFEQSMVKLQSKSSTKKKGFFAQLFSSQNRFQRKLARDGVLPKYGSYIYQSRALFERNILQDVSPAISEKEEISSSSFFSSSTSSFKSSKLSFIFSCNKQNEFFIEVRGSSQKTISTERLTLDDILKYQYDNKRTFKISNGNVTFNTDEFARLIFKKFYHIKE